MSLKKAQGVVSARWVAVVAVSNCQSSTATVENRHQRRRRQALAKKHRVKRPRVLLPLISAFLALSSLQANGESPAVAPEMKVRYMHYSERQADGTKRMTVNSPMAHIRVKPEEDLQLDGIFTYDSMSGASPLYLDAISGASGLGIQDTRYEGQLRVAKTSGDDIFGGTFFFSDEDDYKAISGSFDFTRTLEGTNTQISASLSHSADQVSSTRDPTIAEHRDSTSSSFGIAQIIDEVSMISSSFGIGYNHGYLTDPYKSFDQRPEQRYEFVQSTRYVRYLESTEGSLHIDLRFYADSWDLTSQTMEWAIYQPFANHWMIKPSIRYYSQHKASFFKDQVPPENLGEGYFSADQRLGTFGSLTLGLKLERAFGDLTTVDLGINLMEQRTEWTLMGGSGSNFQALQAIFYGIGLHRKF